MIIIYATILDLIIGDPFKFHPIIAIGNIINFYKKLLYKDSKFIGFVFTCLVLITIAIIFILITYIIKFNTYLNFVVTLYFLYASLATKSLIVESKKVIDSLDDIDKARKYLSYIVGRDTNNLDKEEILKAVIETISENTIDGVIAPLFYMVVGYYLKMPVLFVYIYKTVNTLDSMVGYKNDKYKNFGYVSAKIDDILNYIPARLGSVLMLLSGLILRYNFINGIKTYKNDRYNHPSPNSAHPESVVAGLLGIELGGGSYYFGKYKEKPTIGKKHKTICKEDVNKTYRILIVTVIISIITIIII